MVRLYNMFGALQMYLCYNMRCLHTSMTVFPDFKNYSKCSTF